MFISKKKWLSVKKHAIVPLYGQGITIHHLTVARWNAENSIEQWMDRLQ